MGLIDASLQRGRHCPYSPPGVASRSPERGRDRTGAGFHVITPYKFGKAWRLQGEGMPIARGDAVKG